MLEIHILGSGDARSGSRRDTSALAVQAGDVWTLVDCPGSVVHKLARLGTDLMQLHRLVVTHNHVDHVYGFAHLAHALTLASERPPLSVCAPEETLRTLTAMLRIHGLDVACADRIDLRHVAMEADSAIDASSSCRIVATPAEHGRETIAVRFEHRGRAFVYASDTGPCTAVAALSADADLLIHDCAGLHRDVDAFAGQHSSARQAGEIAAAAGVAELRLIHLGESPRHTDADLVREAREHFTGTVATTVDGDTYKLL